MQTSRPGAPRTVRRRSLAYLVAMNLALSLVAAVALPSRAAAAPLPGGPPGLPETLAVPAQPIVASGGAVGYLPGSWSVTPTGAFTYTIPLDVPAGRAGVQPDLSLRYQSGAGNGPLGVGWSVAGASSQITRCDGDPATDGQRSGVHYDYTDHFCLDGQELVQLGAVPGGPPPTNAEYRTEDDSFAQILATATAATAAMGPDQFVVRAKDGTIRTYLPHAATRTTSGVAWNPNPVTGDVQTSTPRAIWLLYSQSDRSGNAMTFEWNAANGAAGTEFSIHRIVYTSHTTAGELLDGARHVDFTYEQRPDPLSWYVDGVHYIDTQRVKTIGMYAPDPDVTALAWQYNLTYSTSRSGRTLLASVNKCGAGGGCLRAKSFGWSQPADSASAFTQNDLGTLTGFATGLPRPPVADVVDLNGDGLDDLLYTPGGSTDANSPIRARLGVRGQASGAVTPLANEITVTGAAGWPANVVLPASRPLDLYGDGTASIAASYPTPSGPATALFHWDATGQFVPAGVSIGNSTRSVLTDVDGDGRTDYVTDDAVLGGVRYYSLRLNTGGGFGASQASTFPAGPSAGPGGCAAPRVIDLDGDGRGDLVGSAFVNGTCDFNPYVLHLDANGQPVFHAEFDTVGGVVYDSALPQTSGYRAVTGDFNGDGLDDDLLLPDRIDPATGTWDRTTALLWNTGAGLVVDSHVPNVPHDKFADVHAVDVNGDGRADLVAFTDTATTVMLSHGDGTFTGFNIAADGGTADPAAGRATSVVGDFNGDGRIDVARVTGGHELLLTQGTTFSDVLTTVTDQGTNWAAQTVTYSTAWTDHPEKMSFYTCAYPVHCLRRGPVVVRQVASRDAFLDPTATTAPYLTQYAFEDPATDLSGRGFLGFGLMRVWDPQRPSETTLSFTSHKTRVDGDYYPYVERPASVTTATPILAPGGSRRGSTVNTRVTRTTNTYELRHLNNGRSYTVYPASDVVTEWEQSATLTTGSLSPSTPDSHVSGIVQPAQPLRRTTESRTHDDYGNITDASRAVTNGSTTTTHVDFDNRVGDWLISLPTHTAVTSAVAGGQTTRTTDEEYDALGRRTASWAEKGNADPSLTECTSYVLNDFGTTDMVTVSAAGLPDRVTHYVYAPAFAGEPNEYIYPYQTWSDHSVAAARPSTWTAVQPAYGVTVATEDANGIQAQEVIDDLGRPTKVSTDGQDPTTFTYTNRPDNGVYAGSNGTFVTASTGLPPLMPQTVVTTSDALGRTIATSATGFNGQPAVSTTHYDQLGRVASQTVPAPGGTTSYAYDSLDRLLTTTLPDGSAATTSYTFGTTHAVSPGGSVTDTSYTIEGQVASTVAHNGATAVDTSYQYGPFGLLAVAIDDQGHQTSYLYDTRGRQVRIDDPDTGRTTDTYYGTGDLAGQTHVATGATTVYSYDDLGRETSRTDDDGTATFTYDTAPYGIGRLAATHSGDGIDTAYAYDANGRQTQLVYTDEATNANYALDQTYNASGRLATTAFPTVPGHNRFTLGYGYNGFGFATTVSDVTAGQPGTALWTVQSRMPNQALQSASFGASTQTLSYDSPTGRLHNITVSSAAGKIEDLTYGYQTDGLVATRTDNVTNRSETFGHDDLGQLTTWTLANGNAAAVTTVYGYDTVGDLTTVTRNGTVVETHSYGAPGGGQPHTLTGVTDQNGNVATSHYDGQGRQTSGDGRTATYTAQSLPKTVTVGGVTTTFAYDAFGQRVKQSMPTRSTFIVPGRYEHRTVAGGPTSDVFTVDGPDGPVAQVVFAGSNTTTEYLLHDSLGSVAATVDRTGAVLDRRFYEPFGARINAAGQPVGAPAGDVDRGFTGDRTDDDLGFIDMSGRVYDPTQHAFLSADPRNRPAANPYSYVRNRPLNYTDPSGYVMCDAECMWWNSYEGAQFAEFEQASEAYESGGAHGLASEEAGQLEREYSEYSDHVTADQRAELEHETATLPSSDDNGYTPGGDPAEPTSGTGDPTPGADDSGNAAPAADGTRSVDPPSSQGTWDEQAPSDSSVDESVAPPPASVEGDGSGMQCESDPAGCQNSAQTDGQPDGAVVGDGSTSSGGHVMIDEMTTNVRTVDRQTNLDPRLVRQIVDTVLREVMLAPDPDGTESTDEFKERRHQYWHDYYSN